MPLFTFRLVMIASVLAISPAASAQGCGEQSTQADLDVCADKDFQAADKALNQTFREIETRLSEDPDGKQRLIAAQKAWIGFRDAECDFQTFHSRDGSIYPMLVSECMTTLTKNRTEALKVYLACDEGDTLCPVPMP
jgi:uncharacterized protein YecT (DUF1311 family)